MIEKFTIQVTGDGLVIHGEGGLDMRFNAIEALMLLNILKSEETTLRRMADDASPLPLSLRT